MYFKTNKIELSGKTLPIRATNYALAVLQEEAGTLLDFNLKLMGWIQKDGKIIVASEPSIKYINLALPLLVAEGFACENKENPYTEAELVRMIDKKPLTMATLIYGEIEEALEIKKKEPKKKPSQRKPKAMEESTSD